MTEDLHVDYYQENQQLKVENARLRKALWAIRSETVPCGSDYGNGAVVKLVDAALATPAESAGPTDAEMLTWLGQSNSIMPADASDIVNGYRWRGKYCGSVRDAIRVAMKAEEGK